VTVFTHAICGLVLSTILGFPHWMGIIFSIVPDMDHILLISRFPRKIEVNSFSCLRSPFHELIGVLLVSFVSITFIVLGIHPSATKFFLLCYITHLFLDFLIGKSYPFKYVNPKFGSYSVSYFRSYAEKILVEMLFVSFFLLILQVHGGHS